MAVPVEMNLEIRRMVVLHKQISIMVSAIQRVSPSLVYRLTDGRPKDFQGPTYEIRIRE